MKAQVLLIFCCLFAVICEQSALAEQFGQQESLNVGRSLSDGKDGRILFEWKQNLAQRAVRRISAQVRKQTGGDNTFLTLRYGNNQPFENGKQIKLPVTGITKVTWEVGGQSSNGQPLIMSAYNGYVFLDSVLVEYDGVGSLSSAQTTTDDGGFAFSSDDAQKTEQPMGRELYGTPQNKWKNGKAYKSEAPDSCKSKQIHAPQIDITSIRLGNTVRPLGSIVAGKYKVEGVISGVCIAEAGYYEGGKLEDEIKVNISDELQRVEFDLRVEQGEHGEIRAYTTDGQVTKVSIDSMIARFLPF